MILEGTSSTVAVTCSCRVFSKVSDYSWKNCACRSEDVVEGEGPEAREGDLVKFNYVCRRANGYFVHRGVNFS